MHTIELGGNVTRYGQEEWNFCGPAGARISRNGYPDPAHRRKFEQTYLWTEIRNKHNSTLPQDVAANWQTDPHGLQGCLDNLANPIGVQWVEFVCDNNTDPKAREHLLFSILFGMNTKPYPSPVLVDGGGHWVVVVGWKTNIEPTADSTPTLQEIHYYDPLPTESDGTDTTISATDWYADKWSNPVLYNGTWQDQYVAILEPPAISGTVNVEMVPQTGERMLSAEEALEAARRVIKEQALGERPQYRLLANGNVSIYTPLLVQDEQAKDHTVRAPHYYIVPFGVPGEQAHGEPLVRVVVLINAYTGALKEVTAFGRPIQYLTRQQALGAVAKALRIELDKLEYAETTLAYHAGVTEQIRSYPFWQVKVGDRSVYVDQRGVPYDKLFRVPGA